MFQKLTAFAIKNSMLVLVLALVVTLVRAAAIGGFTTWHASPTRRPWPIAVM